MIHGFLLWREASDLPMLCKKVRHFSTWPIITEPLSVAFRVMLTWLVPDVIAVAFEFDMVQDGLKRIRTS